MGGCPPDWMLLVGVLKITGTFLYSKRHSPKLGMCLLLYTRVPAILRTPTKTSGPEDRLPLIPHLRKEPIDRGLP